jgi:uncharacterized protein (DUF488 family)
MLEPILTICHSTHPADRSLALLAQHPLDGLLDIWRFPGSRKFLLFNWDNLASALQKAGVEYLWLEAQGNRRHKKRWTPLLSSTPSE